MRPDDSSNDPAEEALKWPGFNARGSLLLPLPRFEQAYPLAATWWIDGTTLRRKDEFHLTLLSRREGALVRERAAVGTVEACFRGFAWSFGLLGTCWHIESADRLKRSIIAECAVTALNPFRAALAHASGVALAATVPHVTLFVGGSANGIGVESVEEFLASDRRLVELFDSGK